MLWWWDDIKHFFEHKVVRVVRNTWDDVTNDADDVYNDITSDASTIYDDIGNTVDNVYHDVSHVA